MVLEGLPFVPALALLRLNTLSRTTREYAPEPWALIVTEAVSSAASNPPLTVYVVVPAGYVIVKPCVFDPTTVDKVKAEDISPTPSKNTLKLPVAPV